MKLLELIATCVGVIGIILMTLLGTLEPTAAAGFVSGLIGIFLGSHTFKEVRRMDTESQTEVARINGNGQKEGSVKNDKT